MVFIIKWLCFIVTIQGMNSNWILVIIYAKCQKTIRQQPKGEENDGIEHGNPFLK